MNLPTRHLLAVALAATLAIPALAAAQDSNAVRPAPPRPGTPMPPRAMHHAGMFDMLDANHDGRISAAEHAAGVKAMFAGFDANGDGTIERNEFPAPPGMDHHGPAMMLMMADANHDGVVTAAEHAAAAQAMFDRMDANHDGRLAGDELHPQMQGGHMRDGGMHDEGMHDEGMHDDDADDMPGMDHDMDHAGHHAGMAQHGMEHGMDGHAGHPAEMEHDGMRRHDMPGLHARLLAAMDANHDGVVTAAEVDAGGEALFSKVDADHDGSVTRAEFEAGMASMHGMAPAPGR